MLNLLSQTQRRDSMHWLLVVPLVVPTQLLLPLAPLSLQFEARKSLLPSFDARIHLDFSLFRWQSQHVYYLRAQYFVAIASAADWGRRQHPWPELASVGVVPTSSYMQNKHIIVSKDVTFTFGEVVST